MNDAIQNLRERFAQLDERFRSRSIRERALLTAMAAAAVFFSLDQALIQPVTAERDRVQVGSIQARESIRDLGKKLEGNEGGALTAEETRIASETKRVGEQIEAIDLELATTVASLVPPEAIVSVLEELLAETPGMRLVSLRSHAPKKVGVTDSSDEGDRGTDRGASRDPAALYRHGLTLEIEGHFEATLDYLQRVENSRWNLLWQRLEYRVEDHPKATITIDLNTISGQEEWVGV